MRTHAPVAGGLSDGGNLGQCRRPHKTPSASGDLGVSFWVGRVVRPGLVGARFGRLQLSEAAGARGSGPPPFGVLRSTLTVRVLASAILA